MARASKQKPAQANNSKSSAQRKGDRVALKDAPAKGRKSQVEQPEIDFNAHEPRIFDDRTKRDIAGVVVAVVAVVLFLAAVLQPSGLVTDAMHAGLHLSLGLGAYVLPFLLVGVGASMLVRLQRTDVPFRLGVGFAFLFVAFVAVLALFTPGAGSTPDVVFDQAQLSIRGGYVGAGIAWCLLKLFGQIISVVLLFGIALAGAVVIGFSLSGALESAQRKGNEFRDRRRERLQDDSDALPATPFEAVDDAFGEVKHELQQEESAHAPKREAHGVFSGFGASKKRETSVAAAQAQGQPDPEQPVARIRRADARQVPRDLSRPRRASETLSTQLLQGRRPGQSAPASPVDAYWPSEYSFNENEAYASQDAAGAGASASYDDPFVSIDEQAAAADVTQLFGQKTESQTAQRAAAQKTSVLRRGSQSLPWEDEEEEEPASAPKPKTRRLADAAPAKTASAAASAAGVAATAAAGSIAASAAAPTAAKTRVLGSTPKPNNHQGGEERNGFTLPAFSLVRHTEGANQANQAELSTLAADLQETLEDFGVMAKVVGWVAGPTVTLFKVDLPAGVRVSKVTGLTDDIALALAAPGVRIFAPIPGTNYVGIEVPNRTRQNVLLGDVLKDAHGAPLEMAIGKDVEGNSIVVDLAKMPHLLIGGTTGSGKSVAINAMIMSILMRATPDEVRFIMIDPKRVEFTPYNGIPHLYVPVVTENKEAASALSWGVAEMERRLKVMSKAGVRNISQYNSKVESGQFNDEEVPEDQWPKKMPYIVIIIDELADLMMNVGKEVELSISRIAQLARAAGIHMIVATQRPSTNVVTGLIKANITNRIAFNVASGIDSRVILDTPGAENLIGLGDMLFSKPEWPKPQRLQGCFVSEEEIEAVVSHLKEQGEPEYHSEILQTNVMSLGNTMPDGSGGSSGGDDPLLWEAADIVVASGLGSTSNIQRKLSVGYSRAGRIMDMLEEKGIVGPPNGSKPREVLVDEMELESLKAFEAHDALDDEF